MRLFFVMFIAYLIGSIPTGYLFARFKNIDIRERGSGNVGATNVLRVVGKVSAFFTLLLDILKGFIVVIFLAETAYSFRMNVNYPEYVVALALCVVVGHNWPIFLDFKGGKGVATSAGVLLGLCPKLLFIGLGVWILVFLLTRIVSLASIISTVIIPLSSYFYQYPAELRFLTIILAVLIIFRHKTNIERLLKKEEQGIL